MLTPKDIAELIVKTIDGKKAHDIKLLRTTDVTMLADYFVICTATSTTQIKTLADEVEAVLEAQGEAKLHREGHRGGEWTLLDYSAVVVHVFTEEAREFYSLERLWSDADPVDVSQYLTQD